MTAADAAGKEVLDGAKLDYRITQISLVVRDLRKTMEQYHTILGWGPWNVFEHTPPAHHDTRVEGEPVHYTLLGAETYVGGEEHGMNFELLQPLEGPSLWQKFLDEKGEGIYSIAVMFKTREESEAAKQHFETHGMKVNMSARIGDHIEYYYVESEPILKLALESGSGHAIDFVNPLYVYP
jgi:Glyoxalase/Bleomycin resistance protein/Dioxygenase superfamily